jgi:hypothetical protein
MAVATCLDWGTKRTHPDKVRAAKLLHTRHLLPDISTLLPTLNDARKAAAYGDIAFPTLDAEALATHIESYRRSGNVLEER